MSSTTSALIPGSGRIAEPGFARGHPGNGLIIIAPVSVCHQVSTMGTSPPPMWSRYQIQASGLIGSPTLPSRRQAGQVELRRDVVAPLHEGPDRGRCRVQQADTVLLHDLPPATLVRVSGCLRTSPAWRHWLMVRTRCNCGR